MKNPLILDPFCCKNSSLRLENTGVSKQSTHEALDEERMVMVKIKNKKNWGRCSFFFFFTFSLSIFSLITTLIILRLPEMTRAEKIHYL